MKRFLPAVPLMLCAGACDRAPARIEFQPPGYVLSSSEVALQPRVLTQGGDVLEDARPRFAVAPPDLAVVTASAGVRCLRSGDGTLSATAGPVRREEPLRCRLVETLRMPSASRLIIPNAPVAVAVSALDASGAVLHDVPVTLGSSNPSIFRVEAGALAPVSVGTANLVASAGERTASTPVTVVRKVRSEPLLLNDGRRVSWSLNQGHYEIEAQVRSTDGSRHGITLAWVGGTHCQDAAEAQLLRSECTIENTGSVIIENPTTFGLGPAADGVVAMYEVP
ncbi:hypothetical protein [Corallococcus sp. Z5C101001]|uniref:hypothetical protein n=1 Tax=Corallococcus sp. Z5C101001 TaxID=2596829 RepID=UPI001180B248|nr:hypothetical protein [Corallococcus sp. Z5C101001]TSC23139.1 hypothetical protein FOF48_31025 [Corallococcus sp. Z5C101001]